MQMPDDLVDEACEALSHRTYAAHELADHLWPERVERPLAAKKRAGHAMGRDLVLRGLAIQNPDGTYSAAATSVPAPPPPAPPTPPPPSELQVDENGSVVEVQRRHLGRLAAAAAPTPAAAMQPAELQVAPNGEVVEVQRRTLGRVAAPEQPAADGELVVDPVTGVISRVRREVLGRVALPPRPPVQQQPQPPPQQQPQPPPQHQGPHPIAVWLTMRGYPEMMAIAQTSDLGVRESRLRQLNAETNALSRIYGLPEVHLPPPLPPPPPPWAPTAPPPPPAPSPPMQPPPGTAWVPGFGYIAIDKIFEAMR